MDYSESYNNLPLSYFDSEEEENMPDEEKTVAVPVVAEQQPGAEQQIVQDFDIDTWITTRKEFIDKVGKIMVEGKDYHIIQNKKSLAKGGAEKIASIFGWTAEFCKDTESLDMLGEQSKGWIMYICDLRKGKEFVGQGRGAAAMAKNGSDANKTIKMAQKSGFIDAVIRASGLSDIYSQDLEDMNPADISSPGSKSGSQRVDTPFKATTAQPKPISAAQIKLITKLQGQLWLPLTPEESLKKFNTVQASLLIDELLVKVKESEASNGQ